MATTFRCPHCGKQIEVTDALTHQIEERILESLNVKHKKELEEVYKKAQADTSEQIRMKYLFDVKNAEKAAEEEKERNSKLLKQLENLSEEIRSLRRKDEERELEMKKKLILEEEKIRSDALTKAEDEQKFRIKEKDLKIEQLMEDLENMKRKAQQGSQQMQGEVLELDLEEKLKENFVSDEIIPIAKGVQGADILQKVKNRTGKVAGTILWETKRAKWTPSWIPKLKEDGRKNDATMVVLVCENLPQDIKNIKTIEGVIITSIQFSLSIAGILRRNLMLIAAAKSASVNKDEKLEMLYEYIQSDAFRHRFEAFSDVVKAMEEDLLTERRSMERIWKKRETQIKRMSLSSSRMFGELQGVMGNTLPDIKALKLESGE